MTSISDAILRNSDSLAHIWVRKVRQSGNLNTYNGMTENQLLAVNAQVYRTLALWFDRETDKNRIGAFFVDIGKNRRREGFAVSEVSYAIFLAQRSVLEYLTGVYLPENRVEHSAALALSGQIADYFLLGSYYMMKGYLEDTFIALARDESLQASTLRKYFSDEFFFRDNA